MEIQTDRLNQLIADLRVNHIQEVAILRRQVYVMRETMMYAKNLLTQSLMRGCEEPHLLQRRAESALEQILEELK